MDHRLYRFKKGIKPFLNILDHKLLNEISGLENPTTENLAVWLWQMIKPIFPDLVKIELKEYQHLE